MITIVNYGVGNVQAIANIYRRLHIPVQLATTGEELANAEKLILPGVGAFDGALSKLNDSGMRDVLNELVVEKERPVLGICVGMQMLAQRSDEGTLPGLGWIPGEVKRFDERILAKGAYLPHMGWNDVVPKQGGGLFSGLEQAARFYFLHSYFFATARAEDILAETHYGSTFSCAVNAGNVWGVQFHPEKSHHWGIQLLKNFAEIKV